MLLVAQSVIIIDLSILRFKVSNDPLDKCWKEEDRVKIHLKSKNYTNKPFSLRLRDAQAKQIKKEISKDL